MKAQQKMMENTVEEDENDDGADKQVDFSQMEMPEEDRVKNEVVAPGSMVLLEQQSDFCLYRVVLLKKGVEWYKKICREFRYNVRDFEYKNEEVQKADGDVIKKLEKEEKDKKKQLVMWCHHAFPDAIEQWCHIK